MRSGHSLFADAASAVPRVNIADPTTAAGLVDHLVRAPYPLAEEEALKVMHMLGAMPFFA